MVSRVMLAAFAMHVAAGHAIAQEAAAVTADFPPGEWIDSRRAIELTLDGDTTQQEGRLAVVIGTTEWTGLFETTATGLRYSRVPLISVLDIKVLH